MTTDTASGPVVVTGAGGFVGGRLVRHLHPRPVRALVRERVDHLPADAQVVVDLTAGADALAEALDGAAAVVHLAGHNEVGARESPVRALTETLAMTEALADAARASGVARLVYLSTVHVYGAAVAEGGVLVEDVPPAPRSTYAVSRFACEHLLDHTDLDVVTLRLSNALGAPAHPTVDRWTLVAADLARSAALGRPLRLRTAGLQSRDFVALADAVAIIAACAAPDRVAAGTYNLGTGRPTTVRALAEEVVASVERHTGARPELQAPPAEGPAPAPLRIAVDRLADQGLAATTPLADAVDELVAFCLEHKDAL